jgi:riboflavin transporter FmnP
MINLLQSLHTLLLRGPNDYIGALVGVALARIFLQLVRDQTIRNYVTHKLWSSLVLFVVFTRFPALILHLGILARLPLYALLGSPDSGGTAVGITAVSSYITISLFRVKIHARAQLFLILTRTTLLVCTAGPSLPF